MDLKVHLGKTIRLPAEFFSGNNPADPVDPRVEVVDPKEATVLRDAVPIKEGKGVYRYDFTVPLDAPVGTWKVVWTATIDGKRMSGADPFEVQKPPRTDVPSTTVPVAATRAGATKELKAPQAPESSKAPAGSPAAEKPKLSGAAQSAAPAVARSASAAGTRGEKPALEKAQVKGEKKVEKAASEKAPVKGRKQARPRTGATEKESVKPAAAAADATAQPAIAGRAGRLRFRKAGPTESRTKLSPAKTLLILGAIAIILLGIWFSPRREDDTQAKIDQGVAAQKAGRTDEARQLYEEVLENDPDNKLANFNLGVAAQLAGQPDQAESYYRKSLSSDPNFLPGLFNLAILLEQQDRNDESAETYRAILERYPDNGPVHLNYGFLLAQKLNRVEEGKAEFRRAVELEPALANRIPPEWRPAPPEAGPPVEP